MDRGVFKDLSTERLLLKNIDKDDARFFFREFSHPEVTRYLMDAEPMAHIDEAVKWIDFYTDDDPDCNRWIIIDTETGVPMGTCGFHVWDRRNQRIEVGYDLFPDFWGKGYMYEALRGALRFAFQEMDVNRVCAIIHPDNQRSVKLAEKLGFKREGLLRDYYFHHGRYHDHVLYSLLAAEFEKNP